MKDKLSFKRWCKFAVDMDIELLNFDKNNKIVRTSHKKIENQIYHLSKHEKRPKLPNKNIHSLNSSGNYSLITIIPLENSHLTEITTAENLQIEEIHKVSHKVDIVDQTVKTINVEIIIQDQIKQK